jgi:hypothetical protein
MTAAASAYIIRETTAPDGTTTLKITGHAQATVTNQTTGESVTYNISGPGTIVIYPNGAFSIDAAEPNLLWTAPENFGEFPGRADDQLYDRTRDRRGRHTRCHSQ